MKYYKLEFSLDKKEIGDYPQIQKFIKGYNPNKQESCSQIARFYFGIKPDVEVDFNCLGLSSKAKLTDYLSASYLNALTGLLISRKLCDFLSGLRIPDNISYQAHVYQNEKLISDNYLWMHFINSYPELINYSKSDFFLDHSEANFKKVDITSFDEYKALQDKVRYKVNSNKLVVKKEFDDRFDLLRIGVVRNETYVTEIVKDEMVAKEFTGIVFEPADYLVVE
ncbi:MAG TPA: hypothetical protein VM935_19050 [Chitinophagaceae bacterium]|jgi:hypothetical protein|nr:hypothetical protein [Chitinophagaceae bacterium]